MYCKSCGELVHYRDAISSAVKNHMCTGCYIHAVERGSRRNSSCKLECDRRGLELTEERALFCAECKKASVKKKGGEFKLKCERCGVELSEQGAVFCVGCAEKIYSSLPD